MSSSPVYSSNVRPIRIAVCALLIVTGLELVGILVLNSGHLVFTLDDPYIHLALAENLLDGHYGVNRDEFSAPSSSILWPFIIAPIAQFNHGVYGILAMNIVLAAGTMVVLWRLLLLAGSKSIGGGSSGGNTLTLVLVMFIPAINLVGLIYTGMEHSAQLFLAVLITYGMFREVEDRTVAWWFLAAVVAAPLIRYECLALSLPALLFIYCRGYRAKSLLASCLLLALVGSFAVFLAALSLDPIPTSVIVKSSVVSSGGEVRSLLWSLAKSLKSNLSSSRGALLALAMVAMVGISMNRKKDQGLRLLALVMSIATLMHLLVGKYGSFGRYEIYIWSSMLSAVLYFGNIWLYKLSSRIGLYRMSALMVLSCALLCTPYVAILAAIPVASNNIYEQHYQMHRFAVEFYNKPVAVNDLGYVSYRNANYVLDLWGLASAGALQLRSESGSANAGGSVEWLSDITRERNVKLAMIYDSWFRKVPGGWRKLGVLSLGKTAITPAKSSVAFYATDCASFTDTWPLMKSFGGTLPEGVALEIVSGECVSTGN